MSLIRCLGPITLPLAYRRFMKLEIEAFKKRRLDQFDLEYFAQERVVDPFDTVWRNPTYRTYYDGDKVKNALKPIMCSKLEASLSKIMSGKQNHLCMTAVSMDDHADEAVGEHQTVLLIPYQVSEHHHLKVGGEVRQLLPNHLYSFNQTRQHALLHLGTRGPGRASKPCSILNINFNPIGRRRA